MRLSDLMEKGGDALDKSGNEAATRLAPGPAPSSAKVMPQVATPQREDDGNENAAMRSYDSIPTAIYKAAEQLKVSIPLNKEITMREGMETLARVFAMSLSGSGDLRAEWSNIQHLGADICALIAADANFARVLERDPDQDDQVLHHCMNTTFIAVDLASNVSRIEHSNRDIAVAALLHDIGLISLGIGFDHTETEEEVEQHVAKGVELLEQMGAPNHVVTMVAQHHEAIDGSGYPAGISQPDVLISSQVISLAEAFERTMAEARCAEDATNKGIANYVQTTIAQHRKKFGQDVLKAFISLQGFYPDGTIVELTNRSICMVIRQNTGSPLRPVVKVVIDGAGNHPDEVEIKDLQSARSLSIIRAITNTEAVGTA